MSKFLLHRIDRLASHPAEAKATAGLEAAACVHQITCYERDPKQFSALESHLPKLRQQLTDYLKRTDGETAAYLELKRAQQAQGRATMSAEESGSQAKPTSPTPARVEMVHAQFGWNWVLLDWEEPAAGARLWGYRVYRTDKRTAPVLVATVVEPEALVLQQPEGLKLYYFVTAFNAVGESLPSPDFGLMLNEPEQAETGAAAADPGATQGARSVPAHEMPIRRELGKAMLNFIQKLTATRLGNDEEDAVMRQVATEEYRQAILEAARRNIEVSLAWHTLAVWTEEAKERIGYFARALECRRAETAADPPKVARDIWVDIQMQADCLFEIGRVHFHEGAPDAARRFLTEALPLAQRADALQAEAGVTDDRLEGRIAELLLQQPDEDGLAT